MAIISTYGLFFVTGIGCPIKFLTGVSCAGCGMTRAWWYFLHGDLRRAFFYHPLFLLPIFATFVILLRKRFSQKVYYGIIAAICVVAIAVYLYRLTIPHQNIVVFRPQDGFFVRMIRMVLRR
ncbi:MAG: DUF2752 domain-containing protein [Lachnospiraceae bacterium]|nr:DUF2752 domain-containing protein [Lachnospiraceae bacterium]MBQ1608881.1 DUF2752 domain-containing protein [Lachnospiraceae bacterium]MBQ1639732.1 DUF2752 domain-containing protein [Lachnospiraceae bacterium]MBQ1721384.1 DUF2752 domain-containing protein [Lachnospiraceae bacterium]MBQ2318157.1 DUF2752 domain-containing protein [Lachnospiraceae bacterium]